MNPLTSEQIQGPIQEVMAIFEKGRRGHRCERVALLGPRRSGKTTVLENVSTLLREKSFKRPSLVQVRLDLAQERFIDLTDPSRQLSRTLRSHPAVEQVFRIGNRGRPLPQNPTLTDLMVSLLERLGSRHLLLEIDHLESAPLYFAKTLAQELHPLLEMGYEDRITDDTPRRLGLLVAGSLSLHNLLDLKDSGLSHCRRIPMPWTDPSYCESESKRMALERGIALDNAAVYALSEWTRGEPAFCEPVLNALKKSRNGGPLRVGADDVIEAAGKLSSLRLELEPLAEIVLEIHRDPELRAECKKILKRGSSPRPVSDDISKMELSGVLVNRRTRYEFRNEMIKTFVARLFQRAAEISFWDVSALGPPHLSEEDGALDLPLKLVMIARDARLLGDVRVLLDGLKDLFLRLIRKPAVHMSLFVRLQEEWWVLDRQGEIQQLSLQETNKSVPARTAEGADRLATRTEERGRSADGLAYFDATDRLLVVGIPLGKRESRTVVVTAVERGGAGTAWSEATIATWQWYVRQQVGALLSAMASSEASVAACQQLRRAATARREHAEPAHWTMLWPPAGPPLLLTPPHIYQSAEANLAGVRLDAEFSVDSADDEPGEDQYPRAVRALSDQMSATLNQIDPSLLDSLKRIPQGVVLQIVGELSLLRLPIELAHFGERPLTTVVPIARQVSRGVDREMNAQRTLENLMRERAISGRPLRVLIVASAGELAHARDEVRIVENLVRAGAAARGLAADIHVLGGSGALDATFAEVSAKLQSSEWDLFHFAGHGAHGGSDDSGRTGIQLRDTDGWRTVTTGELRSWLERARPWMVYLSACTTAKMARALDDSLTVQVRRHLGTVEAVLEAGVSVIVGYRWEVPDYEAKQLAEHFYGALFASPTRVSHPAIALHEAIAKTEAVSSAWAAAMVVCQCRS